MHVVVEGDKQRFVNLDARSDNYEVHSVEISDERSLRPFITLFLKNRTPKQDGWVYLSGLRKFTHHDPETYHREDKKTKWVIEAFSDMGPPWTHHYHILMDGKPELGDLKPFKDQIPPSLMSELEEYFSAQT